MKCIPRVTQVTQLLFLLYLLFLYFRNEKFEKKRSLHYYSLVGRKTYTRIIINYF